MTTTAVALDERFMRLALDLTQAARETMRDYASLDERQWADARYDIALSRMLETMAYLANKAPEHVAAALERVSA